MGINAEFFVVDISDQTPLSIHNLGGKLWLIIHDFLNLMVCPHPQNEQIPPAQHAAQRYGQDKKHPQDFFKNLH